MPPPERQAERARPPVPGGIRKTGLLAETPRSPSWGRPRACPPDLPFPSARAACLVQALWPFVHGTGDAERARASAAASVLPPEWGPRPLGEGGGSRTGCQLLPRPRFASPPVGHPVACPPTGLSSLALQRLVQRWACDPMPGRPQETTLPALEGTDHLPLCQWPVSGRDAGDHRTALPSRMLAGDRRSEPESLA